MKARNSILVSFDVEEFDLPLEYGQTISEAEQMKTGYEGLEALMEIVEPFGAEMTFFTTANFASRYTQAVRTLAAKHEIASHTFYHSRFSDADLLSSKMLLENITGVKVYGLRMPRMRPVEVEEVIKAGYLYDSSINPTWLPGRYNNLRLPRTAYTEGGLTRMPASVTPNFRIPLFWLTFKNFPYALYLNWVKKTLKKDGYVCLYFHPWEFTDLSKYNIPGYIKRDAGTALKEKLKRLFTDLKNEGEFMSMYHYLASC